MIPERLREWPLVLLAAAVFLLSACGTLQIDTEPAVAEGEPSEATLTPAPIDLTAPTPAQEEVPVITTEAVTPEVVDEATAGPVNDLLQYENTEYGFSLNYPSSWLLVEVNDEAFVGPGSRSVQLSQGTVTLVIGYRRAGEEVALSGSGAPGGEFEVRGAVQILGQDVERHVIVYEGKDKVVMYGQPGLPIIAGDLEFALRLDDSAQVAYETVELSQSVQEEADMIASSLAIADVEEPAEGDTVEADFSNWRSYSNETLGYSLMYPGQADIMGADRDKSVEFVGPIIGDEHWPWLTVQHFDSGFFRPPVGTDVRQWLSESEIPYESLDETVTIGGLPAVHYAFEASPQAYGRDEYYVINGDQLFKITLLHAGGQEDWVLYEQFLDSISFSAG